MKNQAKRNWHSQPQQGITLLELMITLAIISFLTGVASPALSNLVEHHRSRTDIRQLQMAIENTRLNAITHSSTFTLCPLEKDRCIRDWNRELTLFQDRNRNRIKDSDEAVTLRLPSASPRVNRSWPKVAFQFDSRGFAGLNNGSFTYCYVTASGTRLGAVWIVSRLGRIRAGQDSDHDGMPETANGSSPDCSYK